MGPHWIEAFRYHRWANLHVLGVCGRLSDEQLELTAAGTYGTIKATLLHMAGGEGRYVQRLGGGAAQIEDTDAFPGVPRMIELMSTSADRLIELAGRIEPDPNFVASFRDGDYRVEPGIVLIQALHHGNDHRTHICTIFGAHGIDYGDMDVWSYGEAIGALRKVS